MSARNVLRYTAISGFALAFVGLLGACDLLLRIGHDDKYIDPSVDCSSGECACVGGFDNCDDDEDNGCETELSIDAFNCGGCGNVCANGLCDLGVCACGEGFVDCDGNPSTGCETEVAVDAFHCGACGHDCGGGACENGACAPVTMTGLDGAVSLATYDDDVFIARCGDSAKGEASVAKASNASSASAQQAAEFMGCASLVSAGNANVYFAAGKQIFAAPLDPFADPTPKDLVPGVDVFASRFFAVTDAHVVFWNDDTAQKTQAFSRVPIGGASASAPIEVVADAVVTAIAVDATRAYWSDQNGLHAWATGDAKPTDIDTALQATSLAVESGTLFFATSTGISSLAVSGGSGAQIVAGTSVKAIAASATHVYWADGSDGSVRRIGRDGTGEVALVKGESFGARVPFALDPRAVYWIAGTKVRKIAR